MKGTIYFGSENVSRFNSQDSGIQDFVDGCVGCVSATLTNPVRHSYRSVTIVSDCTGINKYYAAVNDDAPGHPTYLVFKTSGDIDDVIRRCWGYML